MASSVQPKDKTVNVNGINLHYLDWGNEGKPKIFFSMDCAGIATLGTTFLWNSAKTTILLR